MGKAKSPDYGSAAIAQGEANEAVIRDQTYANRPTQYTPMGYTSYNPYLFTDPASGEEVTRWEQTTGLSSELQDIYNKQVAIQGGRSDVAGGLVSRMGSEFGAPMDWRGLNPMGQAPTAQFTLPEPEIGNPYGTRQRAEDAMYSQATSRLDPMFQGKRQQLETKMRNQGLGPEDPAWKSQMTGLDNNETDAYNQAQWSAVGEGRNESGQMFDQMMGRNQNTYDQALGANQQNYNMALGNSKYSNQIRQQQITEAMTKRGFSLNEINALLSGQQVGLPGMPNFSEAESAQPAPIYQGAVDQGNFDQAAQQQMIDGISAAGGAAMMSDRRLKSNIKKIGTKNGYNWYSYSIFGLESEGVMADEVPAEFTIDVGGYTAVDYEKLGV